jgi:hypothetical protein
MRIDPGIRNHSSGCPHHAINHIEFIEPDMNHRTMPSSVAEDAIANNPYCLPGRYCPLEQDGDGSAVLPFDSLATLRR